MARTKSAPADVVELPPEGKAMMAADTALHGELVTQRETLLGEIERRYGLDQPYDRIRLIAEGREAIIGASERMFALGRICAAIKAAENPEDYAQALAQIGIVANTANRLIRAADRFSGTAKRQEMALRLTSSKLFELLAEPDETLDALADGSEVGGVTLDEVERMTKAELREALRRARREREEEVGALQDIVKRKDERINKLDTDRRKFAKAPFRMKLDAYLREFNELVVAQLSATAQVRDALRELRAMHDDAGETWQPDVVELIDGEFRSMDTMFEALRQLTGNR